MASTRERTLSTGETVWQVLWRDGKKQRSKTYDNPKSAEKAKTLIDTLGAAEAIPLLNSQEPTQQGVTLRELADQWFEWKADDLTPRTLNDYRRDYDNWIDPFFGHRDAATITERDIQTWVDRDLKPLSAKTTAGRHALLHGIYAWASARKRGHVPHNPCKETDLPTRSRKPPKGLRLPEWHLLRDTAYRIDEDVADLILFMASTGWRIGEATALMASALEDDGHTMYAWMTHVNRKGEGVVEGGKSEAAARRIRMLPECAAMLRRRLVGLGPTGYVFTNSRGDTGLWAPNTFRGRWWAKCVEESGLGDRWRCTTCGAGGGHLSVPAKLEATKHAAQRGHVIELVKGRNPTPHWLRHTHVLLCHLAGMSLPEIQRRLGHEDIQTTINTYGRMIDDMSEDVAARLDLLLRGDAPAVVAGEVVNELGA